MPMDFSTFLTQINDALNAENGPNLAYLLRPTSPHGKDLVKGFRSPTPATLAHFKGSIMSPWDEIAIQSSHSLFPCSSDFFIENRGWTLPALFSILRDLRDLAHDADWHAKVHSEQSECMVEAARIVAKAFSNCMTDRNSPPDESRKWGVYYVVGLAMKCYFKVRRISLTKNIIKVLENNADIPALENYPRSHQVTYRYYIGMLSFLNEEYAKAEQELTLAFYHCHIAAHENQARILAYLIPLRILRGHLPSDELMHRFPVLADIFAPALELREARLIELNLLLTLEKARELCLRGAVPPRVGRLGQGHAHPALDVPLRAADIGHQGRRARGGRPREADGRARVDERVPEACGSDGTVCVDRTRRTLSYTKQNDMALQPSLRPLIIAGTHDAPHTLDIFLDYVCPFSAKFSLAIDSVLVPLLGPGGKYHGKVKAIFRPQVQPWHASSTFVHEAGLAVARTAPESFWPFSLALFKRQGEYFDIPTSTLTPLQIREKLAALAAEVIPVPSHAARNFADLLYTIKFSRQNGIHVSPTVLWDGLVANEISSSWGQNEWSDFLEAKVVV
ncbi:Protein CSN12 [Mycena venus]|uniref:Protein CSN12 n=1 Tax=Mycena venus TaxID=2733690 RepID=A0A8H7CXX1_9AGAR|nr:Protein CSN12 [Mycena venus]